MQLLSNSSTASPLTSIKAQISGSYSAVDGSSMVIQPVDSPFALKTVTGKPQRHGISQIFLLLLVVGEYGKCHLTIAPDESYGVPKHSWPPWES